MTDWMRDWQSGRVTWLVDWVISTCGNHGWSRYSRLALVRPRSWVGRPTVDLIRTSWVWIPRSKDFSFASCAPLIFSLEIKLRGIMGKLNGKDTSGKKFRKFGDTSRRKMLLNSLLEVAGNSKRKFWLNGKAPIIWVSHCLTDQNVCLTNQTADWRAEVHWLFGDTSQPIVTWSTFCDIKRSQSLLLDTKTEHKRRVRATASV